MQREGRVRRPGLQHEHRRRRILAETGGEGGPGGAGADVIYDAVGKDTFAGSLAALAVRGHLVSFGQASGPVGSHDIGRMASRSATISRPNYGHYTDTPEKLAPHVTRFFGALRQGVLRVESPTRYELARAADAHRDLEARRTTGALVLMP